MSITTIPRPVIDVDEWRAHIEAKRDRRRMFEAIEREATVSQRRKTMVPKPPKPETVVRTGARRKAAPRTGMCVGCGVALPPDAAGNRRFCGDDCKRRTELAGRRAKHPRRTTCARCGVSLPDGCISTRLYCGDTCRKASREARERVSA